MNYSEALELLKAGGKLARKGWNGKGMFIYLVQGTEVRFENLRNEAAEAIRFAHTRCEGRTVIINSHIDMFSADGSIVVGWLASQSDMLADDWVMLR